MEPQDSSQPHGGFEQLAQDARREARMLRDNEPVTQLDVERVVARANQYIAARKKADGKYTHQQFARELGTVTTGRGERKRVSPTVISQVLAGTYNGTLEPYVRRIDEFLGRERLRGERLIVDPCVDIELARKVRGVVNSAKRQSSIAVVIMDPGQGKTVAARVCARVDSAAVLITITEGMGGPPGVLNTLYSELKIPGSPRDPARRQALNERLRNDRTIVLMVDEAQKLTPRGLELIRDIHDNAAASNVTLDDCRIPVVLFGDRNFKRLIGQGRHRDGKVRPQMVSRMYPVFDSEAPGVFQNRPKGRKHELYGEGELVRILRNDRLRIVTDEGIEFLTRVANLKGYGALRTAIAITRLAYDLCRGECLDVGDLHKALRMMLTDQVARLVIDQVDIAGRHDDVAVAVSA